MDAEILNSIIVTNEHFRIALGVSNPSNREIVIIVFEAPSVSWDDMEGLENVKRELEETAQYLVEYSEKFKIFEIYPSKGLMFYVLLGYEKTLLVKPIANVCQANFISVKCPVLPTIVFGES